MQYTINQLYDILYQRVNDIYDTFKSFFGEANVDLQTRDRKTFERMLENYLETWHITLNENNAYDIADTILAEMKEAYYSETADIYVHWDRVTVTNEHDKSVEIQDLYAKVGINLEGRIPYENRGFLLNRATYTKEQFLSNYLHSHCQFIPKSNFSTFMPPCLGRGPIVNTIMTLKNEYDEVTWMLFCQELAMYVTVESITGRPWKYLEEIGGSGRLSLYTGYDNGGSRVSFLQVFSKENLRDFIKYYLQNGHLTLSYREGKFIYGIPYFDYIIDISNCFIDFYNKHLKTTHEQLHNCYSHNLLYKVLVKGDKFYKNAMSSTTSEDLDNYRHKFVLRFKGKAIYTTILDEVTNDNATMTTIISHELAMYVLNNVLKIINFRYRNEHYISRREDSSPTYQRVIYI